MCCSELCLLPNLVCIRIPQQPLFQPLPGPNTAQGLQQQTLIGDVWVKKAKAYGTQPNLFHFVITLGTFILLFENFSWQLNSWFGYKKQNLEKGVLSQETEIITLISGSWEIKELSLLALCDHSDKVTWKFDIDVFYSMSFLSRNL